MKKSDTALRTLVNRNTPQGGIFIYSMLLTMDYTIVVGYVWNGHTPI